MEIKINKEILDYQETLFFGLTLRQFLCSVLAVLAAVGLYLPLNPLAGRETVGWICIVGAAPFAIAGFFRYNGLTFERFLWAWWKSTFLFSHPRIWKSENRYVAELEVLTQHAKTVERKKSQL